MLDKAVKADKAKALDNFTKGEAGFKDRDLYPFCGGPDGKFTAHPTRPEPEGPQGQGRQGVRRGDLQGRRRGQGQRGRLYVSTPWRDRSGSESTYVTKVGDQVCAVGYYK